MRQKTHEEKRANLREALAAFDKIVPLPKPKRKHVPTRGTAITHQTVESAVQAFNAELREADREDGADSSYYVDPSDVKSARDEKGWGDTSGAIDEGEAVSAGPSGRFHETLEAAGFKHVHSDEAGHLYHMKNSEGDHQVRVRADESRATIMHASGKRSTHYTVEGLASALPRAKRASEAAVRAFWSRWLRESD